MQNTSQITDAHRLLGGGGAKFFPLFFLESIGLLHILGNEQHLNKLEGETKIRSMADFLCFKSQGRESVEMSGDFSLFTGFTAHRIQVWSSGQSSS